MPVLNISGTVHFWYRSDFTSGIDQISDQDRSGFRSGTDQVSDQNRSGYRSGTDQVSDQNRSGHRSVSVTISVLCLILFRYDFEPLKPL